VSLFRHLIAVCLVSHVYDTQVDWLGEATPALPTTLPLPLWLTQRCPTSPAEGQQRAFQTAAGRPRIDRGSNLRYKTAYAGRAMLPLLAHTPAGGHSDDLLA